MRARGGAGAVLAAGLLAPAALHAQDHGHGGGAPAAADVAIGYAAVMPRTAVVLTGESVRWRNDSVRVHTATADDGSFDSGRLRVGGTFGHRFAAQGTFDYHCELHPTIRGSVAVAPVLLDPPAGSAAPGRPFPLAGRAAAAPGTVLRVEADAGAGFAPAGDATTGEAGRFATSIRPGTTARYRVVGPDGASPPIVVRVQDRRVAVTVVRRGRTSVVRAVVTPGAPGQWVVLQLRLRERFGWFPVSARRLGRDSSATFRVRRDVRVPARVRLTLSDRATPLAQSRTVTVGNPPPPPRAHRHGR